MNFEQLTAPAGAWRAAVCVGCAGPQPPRAVQESAQLPGQPAGQPVVLSRACLQVLVVLRAVLSLLCWECWATRVPCHYTA
jgi:hypothetical protein